MTTNANQESTADPRFRGNDSSRGDDSSRGNDSARGDDRFRFNRRALKGGFRYWLYDLLYAWSVVLANLLAPFNRKLREALRGKRRGMTGWEIGKADGKQLVFIHVASYGEFEGVIPLIETLNTRGLRVAVSYSSPSAEKKVASTPGLWARGFMPYDFFHHQLRLLGKLMPSAVLIAKHDFWPNTIRATRALGIPVILINANFHSGSRRNLPVVRWFHRAFMKSITAVWTVSEADAGRVEPLLGISTRLATVGDTRYDRVRQRAELGRVRFRELKEALQPGPVIVAGSTWQPCEKICYAAFMRIHANQPQAKLVIASHEPTKEALARNRALAEHYKLSMHLFSDWKGEQIEAQVLLVDKIGMLADLYTVGWAAYVGGGFGRGVHSVIEPAAHGLPVAFGPNHKVSHEASLLIESGGGFVVKSTDDLGSLWQNWLESPDTYRKAAGAADGVVRAREGATMKIMELLAPFIG